jgi:hypothetical protein
MSGAVRVVHLVWGPLGTAPFASFLDSYRRHSAGEEHRLVVLYNGFAAGDDRAPWSSLLGVLPHEELLCATPLIDLAAYRFAIEQLAAGTVCFLNSYTQIEADGWLAKLTASLEPAEVGLVGAGGSFESARAAAPRLLAPLIGWGFPGFPNPHIRTNGFALDLALARTLDWRPPRRKRQAHLLESGWRSITRQILDRGLSALVVGADGTGYTPERWRESATFRSGGQANALFSDNRTRQYEQAPPDLQARLEAMAWGRSDL